MGESDFATWLPSESPSFGGDRSYWLHAEAYLLIERNPLQLAQNLNLVYTFDLFCWTAMMGSFVLVTLMAFVLSYLGRPVMDKKVTLNGEKTFLVHKYFFLQELWLHFFMMNFGIVFYEFHLNSPKLKFGGKSINWLRFGWVLVCFMLTISFQSSLRARYLFSV